MCRKRCGCTFGTPLLRTDPSQDDLQGANRGHGLTAAREEELARAISAEALDVVAEGAERTFADADPALFLPLPVADENAPVRPVDVLKLDAEAL